MGLDLAKAVEAGQALGKQALYFGCWDRAGHYLHLPNGQKVHPGRDFSDLPWGEGLMDTGLLKNGKRPDRCDGRVWWTCGGRALWYAFFWWDRSVDTRGGCNSGFYVRGFGWPQADEAFAYACAQYPRVIARQKHPLVLQAQPPREGVTAARFPNGAGPESFGVSQEDKQNLPPITTNRGEDRG